jgi:hypothetical protein
MSETRVSLESFARVSQHQHPPETSFCRMILADVYHYQNALIW